MDKFVVEFNPSGFYYGQGEWHTYDEFWEVEADDESEAIGLAKQWYLEHSDDYEEAEQKIESYAWRCSKIRYDEDGYMEDYVWIFD